MSLSHRFARLHRHVRWSIYRNVDPIIGAALEVMTAQQLHYAFNVGPVGRSYVLVNNPKTGLSSLKAAMIKLEDGENAASPHDLERDPFRRITELPTIRPLTHLVDREYAFVSVVRNPYARLASGYRSTVDRHRDPADPRRALWLGRLGLDPSSSIELDFGAFVDVVVAQSDLELDPHFRPQCSQLLVDHLPYRFIGHTETITDDLTRLLVAAGLPATSAVMPHLNRTNVERFADASLYTPTIARKVRERFGADFERFGYCDDPASPESSDR